MPRSQRTRALTAGGALLAVLAALLWVSGPRDDAGAAVAKASSKRLSIITKKFKLKGPDQKRRLVVRCPGRSWPYGGGMISKPVPGARGEGVYPHSYERLGQQQGFHVTAALYDPTHRKTRARKVTLQVACGRRLGHVTPPRKTKYVHPGQTKTVVATCPGHRHLFSGGFQRTDFISRGGDFVTESRAISSKAWRVTGHAFGGFGGELTAIAYCVRSNRPLLSAVKSSTTVQSGDVNRTTTGSCPGKRRLVAGGFRTSPSGSAFFTNGAINDNGSWSAMAFGRSGSSTLTAYGYCMRVRG